MKKHILQHCSIIMLFSISACTATYIPENNLSNVRLNIETYRAGQDQVTHPSVIEFPSEWNGYKYWMAYTPYPFGNGEEENPCIAVSNDLLYWDTPDRMVNPIADNEETGCDELKDSHILYRDDLDRIEVWYLGRLSTKLGGDNKSLLLFRKYSYDGITWSDYEVMSETEYLSPSVIWKDNQYQLWGIGYAAFNNTGTIAHFESNDGKTWTNQSVCSIDGIDSNIPIWHGSVSYYDNEYHFVYIESSNDSQHVYYCHSTDGIHFEDNTAVVDNTKQSNWKILYRPFLLIENGHYELFYGVITENNEWYITKSTGSDMNHLSGLSSADTSKMKQLNSSVTNTHSLKYMARQFLKLVRTGIRIELLVLFPLMYFAHRFLARKKIKKGIIFALYLLMNAGYVLFLLKPVKIHMTVAYMISSLIQALFMYLLIDKLTNYTTRKAKDSIKS